MLLWVCLCGCAFVGVVVLVCVAELCFMVDTMYNTNPVYCTAACGTTALHCLTVFSAWRAGASLFTELAL